jgi:hypothetical protein
MLSIVRRVVAVGALVALSATAAQAQVSFREIRFDLASFMTVDGSTALSLGGPVNGYGSVLGGSVSVATGFYLNDKIALEPSLTIFSTTPDGGDATTVTSFGLAAPFYLTSGKSGLFISPNLSYAKITDTDARMDIGAEVGYKKPINNNLSWRAAAGLRTGDSTNDEMALMASFGISVFLK